ncbi:hypothetical protein VHP8226_03600 [Vibrio hippocampi]|uniref:Uncharacterized protein n=1 Tax=Vibrio hippocampi TaxID=654686 RepID=A0ABM8ZMU9_9VIBR|nr:hypothetical protein VHP8226_03600 [Vibrio hippocampi]
MNELAVMFSLKLALNQGFLCMVVKYSAFCLQPAD